MRGKRVLVADDDPFVLDFCRIVLEAVGHTVRTADSGSKAVLLHQEGRFDVALVDLLMPGMGGLDALRAIREDDRDAAVVLITANADKDSVLQALRLGAKELIEKPLAAETLVSVVDRVSRHDPSRTLRGDLRSMTLTTLLQACCGDRREGRLRVCKRDEDALLYLAEGTVVHAELEEARGEEAFYRLLRWTEGEFEFAPNVRAPERSISREFQSLLLEGLCQMDAERKSPASGSPPASRDWESVVGDSLNVLAEKVAGFVACALIGRGGTVLATCFAPASFDSPGFGVVMAILAGAARTAMARFDGGKTEECVIEGENRLVVLRTLGDQDLVVLADPASAGHTRLVVRDVGARLGADLARVGAPKT